MGAGRSAFIAFCKGKLDPIIDRLEDRLVFEQPFIDRTELLDIEGGIVDPKELARIGMLVQTQRVQAAGQHIVTERAAAQGTNGIGTERSAKSFVRTRKSGIGHPGWSSPCFICLR